MAYLHQCISTVRGTPLPYPKETVDIVAAECVFRTKYIYLVKGPTLLQTHVRTSNLGTRIINKGFEKVGKR